MEVAARLGGGHDAELCDAALGVDLSAAAVRAALGRPAGPPRAGARPRGRRALPDRPGGPAERVEGLDAARALPGVELAYSYRAPGALIEPLLRGPDRAGFVLATGATRAEAEATAREAEAAIRFVVE